MRGQSPGLSTHEPIGTWPLECSLRACWLPVVSTSSSRAFNTIRNGGLKRARSPSLFGCAKPDTRKEGDGLRYKKRLRRFTRLVHPIISWIPSGRARLPSGSNEKRMRAAATAKNGRQCRRTYITHPIESCRVFVLPIGYPCGRRRIESCRSTSFRTFPGDRRFRRSEDVRSPI